MATRHLQAPGSENNPGNRMYPTLWAPTLILSTYGHHSSTMGRPDYPAFLKDESQVEQLISRPNILSWDTVYLSGPPQCQWIKSSANHKSSISDDQVEIELWFQRLISFLLSKTSHLEPCLDECHHLRNECIFEAFVKPSLILGSIPSPLPCLMKGILPFGIKQIRMCRDWGGNYSSRIGQGRDLVPTKYSCLLCLSNQRRARAIRCFSPKNALCSNWLRSPLLPIPPNCCLLSGQISDDELLNEPKYLSATLIFLRSKGIAFPKRFQDLRAKNTFFTLDWLEILLQVIALSGSHWYTYQKNTKSQILHELGKG